MKHPGILLIGVALVSVIPGSVRAQTEQERKWCLTPFHQDAQKGCTAIIQSDQATVADRAQAYHYRGRSHAYARDYARAIADYDEAIRLQPEQAEFYRDRVKAYESERDFVRAIPDYSRLIQLEPNKAGHYVDRGYAYMATDAFDSAIADFDRAIGLDPENASAWELRALTYHFKGDDDRAIADFGEAIRRNPKGHHIYWGRGLSYASKGDHGPAIADFDRAIGLNPEAFEAFYERGLVHERTGKFERAIADYSEAIRLQPWTDYRALVRRCFALAVVGEFSRALADCNAAGDGPLTLYSRGFTHLRMGNYDLAIADFNEVLRMMSRHEDAQFARGVARLKKGDQIGGNSDIAAATAIDAGIAQRFAGYGIRL